MVKSILSLIELFDEKISEIRLLYTFRRTCFNIAVYAITHQTGFDEPKLHTMFTG